jgi:hypothetical protein
MIARTKGSHDQAVNNEDCWEVTQVVGRASDVAKRARRHVHVSL